MPGVTWRIVFLTWLGLVAAVVAAAADQNVADDVYQLRCVPPAAVMKPQGLEADGPPVSVVKVEIRPKRTGIFLDGRLIGCADDFDGSYDHLFLFPGRYRLEARRPGYRTAVFEVDSQAGCLYEVTHRMERLSGTVREAWWWRPERPSPIERVFGPAVTAQAEAPPAVAEAPAPVEAPAGPDLSLRPELADQSSERAKDDTSVAGERGSLRLRVLPEGAAVYVDGAFVATGREFMRLQQPLALVSGEHSIEVIAPGYVPESRVVEVRAGQTVELSVELLEGQPVSLTDPPKLQ